MPDLRSGFRVSLPTHSGLILRSTLCVKRAAVQLVDEGPVQFARADYVPWTPHSRCRDQRGIRIISPDDEFYFAVKRFKTSAVR